MAIFVYDVHDFRVFSRLGTAKNAQSRLFSRTAGCFRPEELADFVRFRVLVRLKVLKRDFLAVPLTVFALKNSPILSIFASRSG